MKDTFKRVGKAVAGAGAAVVAGAHQAVAAVDLTGITLDTTSPVDLAELVLAGLAVMWGIRKLVKLANRS